MAFSNSSFWTVGLVTLLNLLCLWGCTGQDSDRGNNPQNRAVYLKSINKSMRDVFPKHKTVADARHPADFFTCAFPEVTAADSSLSIMIEFNSREALDSVEVIWLRVSEKIKVEPIPTDNETAGTDSSTSSPTQVRIHRWLYIDSLYRPISVSSAITIPNLFHFVEEGLYEMECFAIPKSSLDNDTIFGYRKAFQYEFNVEWE